jgi:multicomponent Na+:H+ antiporter subunit E
MDDPRPQRRGSAAWLALFLTSLAFWLALSGRGDPLYLGAGLASAALVATLTSRLERRAAFLDRRAGPLFHPERAWVRLPGYLAWLLVAMLRSALAVAWVVVHPRLPISPVLARLPTRLRGALPLTVYANSITLTPGTVTVDLDDGELLVHALTRPAAEELRGGKMESRVVGAFGGDGQ